MRQWMNQWDVRMRRRRRRTPMYAQGAVERVTGHVLDTVDGLDEELDGTGARADQLHGLRMHQRRCHGHPHRHDKPRQHKADGPAPAAQGLQGRQDHGLGIVGGACAYAGHLRRIDHAHKNRRAQGPALHPATPAALATKKAQPLAGTPSMHYATGETRQHSLKNPRRSNL